MSNADIAITVGAAAAGGLIGSVLQPVVRHLLSQVTNRAEARRERNRSLRAMVEEELTHARAWFAGLAVIELRGTAVATDVHSSIPVRPHYWRPEGSGSV